MRIRDLKLRLRALLAPARADRDLHDELAFHIELETRKLIDQGVPPEAARTSAHARFGSPTAVADACRDARGTAFVDNTLRDVRFALRSFRRAPLTALTIVATVGVGLGLVSVLFTMLNSFVFRADAVPDVAGIYAVERQRRDTGAPSPFTRLHLDALRRETSVFSEVYAAVPDVDMHVDGRTMRATLVSASFFDVAAVSPAMGRGLTASDDGPAGEPVIVLSDRGWERRFNRDPGVLRRTVLVGGTPFQIVGVMPPGFRGLQFRAPDFWAPLAQLRQFRPGERDVADRAAVEIVGRLRPGVTIESAQAQLEAWNRMAPAPVGTVRPAESIVLAPRRGTAPHPMQALAVFTPLFFAFGLILVIGCANVANLLLARGVARQREIGIRLSLGASRRRIIRQLMTESVLLALAAAVVGYAISRVVLEGLVHWATGAFPVDLGDPNIDFVVPAADWRVALFLILAAVLATAFFALMPALQATRMQPVRTLRGELVTPGRPGRARNALIGMQVFASALLLVTAAIFLRSALASARFDPGLRTADTALVDIRSESNRGAVLQTIESHPLVRAYAAVRPHLMVPPDPGVAEIAGTRTPVAYRSVSPEYFDVFGIPIVGGRPFTMAERDGELPVAIISESMARTLWPGGQAVGEQFRLEQGGDDRSPAVSRVVTVVGISRDVPGFRISDTMNARIFLPVPVRAPNTSLAIRLTGNPELARQTLAGDLTKRAPHIGMIVTMATLARLETLFLRMAFWVSLALGSLALLLTASGLFSVLSYLVEQRTREIGVRMALGATARSVARLILLQTTRPVIYGLLAGTGLAASAATVLMATPAGAMIGQIVHVTDPVAYGASLLVIVAACLLAAWVPAARAARLDPLRTLRQE